MKNIVLRIARPTNNLKSIAKMYESGLDFDRISEFSNHNDFDGIILGHKDNLYHLEFTHHRGSIVANAPSEDNLMVFYMPDEIEWNAYSNKMIKAGFKKVNSLNPYWDNFGITFEDPDGYRVVLQNKSWDI